MAVGWDQPPFYDTKTNRLTWAIRCQSEGEFVINYNSRLLGREGVMSANLVVEPKQLASAKAKYTQLLTRFAFVPGKTYAEFRIKGAKPGDLPIEQPMTFETVVNLKTAKLLGLTVPPETMAQATRVIQ